MQSGVGHSLDLVDHTSGSLDALQYDHTLAHMAEREFVEHTVHDDEDDEDEAQKQADLHEALHLPGIHSHPHPQEPYYSHDPNLQPLPYNLPLGLQFQYLHPQTHIGINSITISDVTHFTHQQELIQLQSLGPPIPEYHDPSNGNDSQERLPKAPRKSRWRPTPKQKERLEAFWAEDQYPDRKKKQNIAAELEAVTAEQVSRWFKHRRESMAQKGQFAYRSEAAAKFLNEQVTTLEQVFKSNAYPSREDIKLISEQMVVSQQRVKNWFKARRCRLAQKGEFEFRQSDTVQVRPTRPIMGERVKRIKDEITITSTLDEPDAKRQELMPSVPDIVDVVESHHPLSHHHLPPHHHISSHPDLPPMASLVPDDDDDTVSMHPLDHMIPKSEHDQDDDHVFSTQDNHLLQDTDSVDHVIKVEALRHLTEDVVHT